MVAETQQFASTNIDSASYDPDTRQLDVTFLRNGATYSYIDVDPEIWTAFAQASSPGKFFRQEIAARYGTGL